MQTKLKSNPQKKDSAALVAPGGVSQPKRRFCGALKLYTANAVSQGEMRLSGVTSTGNVAGVADGEWALISTYGDHPSPDGSYVQHFPRSQAEQVVKTWNSITGTAARFFKNLYHGLGAKSTCPVWEGHPDSDKQRWPKEKLLAEISALRLGESGLEGRITWNAKGLANRTRGPLFPSSLWWHFPPSGVPPVVFPELLESVGLWPNVNIPGLPAWTANATFSGESPEENQNENAMTPAQLAALARALNLPESTDAAKIIETAQSAYQLSTANAAKVQENETALQTAKNHTGFKNRSIKMSCRYEKRRSAFATTRRTPAPPTLLESAANSYGMWPSAESRRRCSRKPVNVGLGRFD